MEGTGATDARWHVSGCLGRVATRTRPCPSELTPIGTPNEIRTDRFRDMIGPVAATTGEVRGHIATCTSDKQSRKTQYRSFLQVLLRVL